MLSVGTVMLQILQGIIPLVSSRVLLKELVTNHLTSSPNYYTLMHQKGNILLCSDPLTLFHISLLFWGTLLVALLGDFASGKPVINDIV